MTAIEFRDQLNKLDLKEEDELFIDGIDIREKIERCLENI